MKKILVSLMLLVMTALSAHAQFEKEVWYVNASLTGLDLSHSKNEGTNFGFALTGGAFEHLSCVGFKKNLVCLTPEVGYAFFLGRNVTIEPSVYYDLSFSDISEFSKLGFKIGFGVYF